MPERLGPEGTNSPTILGYYGLMRKGMESPLAVLLSATQLVDITDISGRTLAYGKTTVFRDKESHAIRS